MEFDVKSSKKIILSARKINSMCLLCECLLNFLKVTFKYVELDYSKSKRMLKISLLYPLGK